MTPLGSNPTEGSSPASNHLGLLSGEKFWPRAKVENNVRLGKPVFFYVAPQQITGCFFARLVWAC